MQREMKTARRNKVKTAVMDAIIEKVEVTVPSALLTGEIQQLKQQALQQMGGGQNLNPSMLPDDLFSEQASRRVKLGLVLGEVIKVQAFKADPGKVREAVEELASTYESPDEVVNWYYSNEEQLSAIESGVLEDAVFDYILDTAKVTEKTVTYQEVIKPAPKSGAGADEASEGE